MGRTASLDDLEKIKYILLIGIRTPDILARFIDAILITPHVSDIQPERRTSELTSDVHLFGRNAMEWVGRK
jgi:hypothetical protein